MGLSDAACRRPRTPTTARGLRALVVLVMCGLAAACSSGTAPAAAPTVAPGPSPSASPSAADDPPGAMTCHKLRAAVNDATLMDPGVVDDIVTASSTADAPVADAAHRLASAYASAIAAHNTDGEPDAVAAVSAAGAEMSQVCADSGLEADG